MDPSIQEMSLNQLVDSIMASEISKDNQREACKLLMNKVRSEEAQLEYMNILKNKSQFFSILHQNLEVEDALIFVLLSLTNLCTNNYTTASFILQKIEENNFEEILNHIKETFLDEKLIKSRRVLLHFLVNILNSLLNSESLSSSESEKINFENLSKINPPLYALIDFSFLDYFDPDFQATLKDNPSPEAQKLDEWLYLFFTNLMTHESLNGGIKWLERQLTSQSGWLEVDKKCSEMPEPLKVFYQYLFSLMLKTVSQKIYFSVIRQINTDSIKNDDYYNQSGANGQGDASGNGIQINMSDFHFLKNQFLEMVNKFQVAKNAKEASDILEYLHWIIKLMIPINFLGGYNREVQEQMFPEFLGQLSKLMQTLQNKYYAEKIVLEERATYELNVDIIRLAGNIVHTSQEAQDFLIDKELLLCYLSHAGYDKNSPFQREATVVFIRYVTDSNQRARDVIKTLEVSKIDPDSTKDLPTHDFM